MVINIEATIRWKGYNPNDLSPGSDKRVWVNCDNCGKGKWGILRDHNRNPKYLCKPCSVKGENNPMYGKCHSRESRKKISAATTGDKHWLYGKHLPKETCKKISKSHTGKYLPKETCKKISRSHIGIYPSKDTLKKMSKSHTGKHLPKETCKKISKSHIGIYPSKDTLKKMSATLQGILYDEWEGFAREKPYCPAFNKSCRESNREKYGRKCFICGLPESENRTKTGKLKKLAVHHIDMNKNQGCDDNRWRLIPVCLHHHGTVHNDLWRDRIMYLLNTCWK